jgi:hypothetical protein
MKHFITLFFLFWLGTFNLNAQCVFSENFDTYSTNVIPTDWTVRNTTGGNAYAYIQTSTTAPSPSRYLRMYSGSTLAGELILITPMITGANDGLHRLRFYIQGSTGNPSELIVGTMNDNSATGVFTPITTISSYPSSIWEEVFVTIPAGTDQYIAFKHSLTTTLDQLNLDNICVQLIPSCLEVNQVVLSNPGINSVDLTWNQSGSTETNWQYVVQPSGTGLPTADGTDYSEASATPSLTIGSLDSNTVYEAYVRSKCGDGDFGEWIVAAATIRTLCDDVTTNYCEDFVSTTNNTVPFCWTASSGTGNGGSSKVVYQYSGYNKNMYDLYYPITASGEISATSPNIGYATDGLHRLRITAGATDDTPNLLEVGTIDGTGSFVLITALTLSTNRNATYLVDLPNNGNAHYSFRHNGTSGKHIYINEVCIEDIPACLEVPNIQATAVTATSVTATWTTSASAETNWQYIVQPTADAAPTDSTQGTDTSLVSNLVSTLSPNTNYSIYVRANCAANGFGAWSVPVTFLTPCSAIASPFFEGFQGANVNAEEVKPCWSVFDTGNGDLKTFGTSYSISPIEGALQLRFYFTNTTPVESLVLISPEFSDLDANKQVRFKLNKRAGQEADFNILVGTVASPTDMDSFQLIDGTSINQTSVIAGPWTEFTIDLTNYNTTLGHKYIAFKPQHSGTGPAQNVFMDEFTYEQNPNVIVLNDEAADAYVIQESTNYSCDNQIVGTFAGATHSPEFPCTAPIYANRNDLWYKFTPTVSGLYSITGTPTSGVIGVMSMFIFSGTPGNLTAISSGCATNFTSRNLTAGETYYISVAAADPTLEYRLCIYRFPDAPANDEITNAISLTESPDFNCVNGIEGTTGSATHSSDSVCPAQNDDVWYTFTASETREYTFRKYVLNGGALVRLTVYSGTPGNLTAIGSEQCSTALILANLTAGTTYYVAVSTTTGQSLPSYFTMCVYPSPPPPSNDDCDAPIALTVGQDFDDNAIVATNTSATVNATNSNFPACGTLEFSTYGRDVWFTAVIPESGTLYVETRAEAGSLLTDTVMETYTGSCGTSTLIPFYYQLPAPNVGQAYCNEQFVIGGNPYAGIRFTNKQPGTTVIIRVWAWARQFGDFRISAYDPTPACDRPTNILVTPQDVTATISWDEPTPAPNGYYYVVQPANGGYPGSAPGTFVNGNSVTHSGLFAETNYEVYVRSNCDTSLSAWEGPFAFTTTTLGNSQFDTTKFQIYPNPVQSILNITNTEMIKDVTIFSINGQKVYTNTFDSTELQINVSHLAKGVYILKAATEYSQQSFKIVVY